MRPSGMSDSLRPARLDQSALAFGRCQAARARRRKLQSMAVIPAASAGGTNHAFDEIVHAFQHDIVIFGVSLAGSVAMTLPLLSFIGPLMTEKPPFMISAFGGLELGAGRVGHGRAERRHLDEPVGQSRHARSSPIVPLVLRRS